MSQLKGLLISQFGVKVEAIELKIVNLKEYFDKTRGAEVIVSLMDSSLPVVYLKETKLHSLALPRAMNGDIDLLFGTQPEGNACSLMLKYRNKNSSLNRLCHAQV